MEDLKYSYIIDMARKPDSITRLLFPQPPPSYKKKKLLFERYYHRSATQGVSRHSRNDSTNPRFDEGQPIGVRLGGRLHLSTDIRFTFESEVTELATPRNGRIVQTPRGLNRSQYSEYMNKRTGTLTAKLPADERVTYADSFHRVETPLNTIESLPDGNCDYLWRNEKLLTEKVVGIEREAARLRMNLIKAQEKNLKLMGANKRKDEEIEALKKGSLLVFGQSDKPENDSTPKILLEYSAVNPVEELQIEKKRLEERCEALEKRVEQLSEMQFKQHSGTELQPATLLSCEMKLKAEKEKNSALEEKLSAGESVLNQQGLELMQQKSALLQQEESIAALQSKNSGLETKTRELEATVVLVTADAERQKEECLRLQAENAMQGSRIKELKERLEVEEKQKNRYRENYETESRKLQSRTEENKELCLLLETALSQTLESIAAQLKSAGNNFIDVCNASDSENWLVTDEQFTKVLAQCGVDVEHIPIKAIAKVYTDVKTGQVDLGKLGKRMK